LNSPDEEARSSTPRFRIIIGALYVDWKNVPCQGKNAVDTGTNAAGDQGQGQARPRRLLDQVRTAARRLHYGIRTEDAYTQWVKRFVLFHGKRHPAEMVKAEVVAFL
jgi:hypothetical protein